MSETPTIIPDVSGRQPARPVGFAATISRNIAASLARVAALSLVAIILPAYLTHHLPVATYAAWVLILQLGAYVSYLDLGIQTGVSKFVAEYDARGDHAGAARYASAGLALMIGGGILGVVMAFIVASQVPRLFSTMPPNLYRDVRISILLVGSSLSFGLVCAVYSAVFLGLQRYWIPMTISVANRASYAAVVLLVVGFHGNLTAMGVGVAAVNVVTGLLQVVAWRKKAAHIPISVRSADVGILKAVARFCSAQYVLTVAMLCITGLDVTIVGHYDYLQTAYYSIATMPTSFVLLIISSLLNPLMPASSAMSTQRSAAEMGNLLTRITRYITLVLLLTGLPLIVCGFPILRLWVGSAYALHTFEYLRILVFANIIRSLCAPYATMIVATGRQGAAAASAVSEALVNLSSSIYLASRFGAIGVAIGTVIGAVIGVSLHFAITMQFTQRTLGISRSRLFVSGLLRPALIAVPSLILVPLWGSHSRLTLTSQAAVVWGASTVGLAWLVGLNRNERNNLVRLARNRFWPR